MSGMYTGSSRSRARLLVVPLAALAVVVVILQEEVLVRAVRGEEHSGGAEAG